MAKKRKNSNYVTEKRTAAKLAAERKAKKELIIKRAIAIAVPILIITALVLTIIFVGGHFGLWDKAPEVTGHAVITVEGFGNLHIELYGESAPMAVQSFLALIADGSYDKIQFDRLIDGRLETTSINGFDFKEEEVKNLAKHKKGSLSMLLVSEPGSANGEFFITTEKRSDLDGKCTVFGRIDAESMDVLDQIIASIEVDENGVITAATRPKITGIATHEPHDH